FKMKKTLSVFLAVLMLMTAFTACKKDEDLNWMVSFEYEEGCSWIYDMEKEGVLTLETREDIPEDDESKGNTMFIFEPVGEGEVFVTFTYLTGGGEKIKTVKYRVVVDENYKCSATIVEDVDNTTAAVSITTKEEAEQIISDYVGVADKETGNEIVVEFERVYEEDGVRWYVFRASTVVTEGGKSYLRFYGLYAVSQFGEIKELPAPEDATDKEIDLK
ncbi:MAG: hypothetical protein IKA56_01860, partial [Clostridia bacterium]|nr:hypothetical protein [Clostridia bacterium]